MFFLPHLGAPQPKIGKGVQLVASEREVLFKTGGIFFSEGVLKMVLEVKQSDLDGAIAEQEKQLRQEDDVFSDEMAELVCATYYLEVCGMSQPEIHSMTVADILGRYRRSLQEEAF